MSERAEDERVKSTLRHEPDAEPTSVTRKVIDRQHLAEKAVAERREEYERLFGDIDMFMVCNWVPDTRRRWSPVLDLVMEELIHGRPETVVDLPEGTTDKGGNTSDTAENIMRAFRGLLSDD